MLKAAFDIISTTSGSDNPHNMMLIEVSEKIFGYALYNKEKKEFFGLRQYNLEDVNEKNTSRLIAEIIDGEPILQNNTEQTMIIYNFPESSIVPRQFFDNSVNKNLIELSYGNVNKGLLAREKVSDWDFYNVYLIPNDINALVQQKFSAGKYCHYYTLLISSLQEEIEKHDTFIKTIFYPDIFIAAAFNEHKLQLLQTYSYQTPEDVAYVLLSICKQLCFNQNKLLIIISGLIDEESSLYLELLKYFQNVSWDSLPEAIHTNGLLADFPPQYFSPLLKIALCV